MELLLTFRSTQQEFLMAKSLLTFKRMKLMKEQKGEEPIPCVLMNAEQMERVKSGLCPYCGSEMPNQEPKDYSNKA